MLEKVCCILDIDGFDIRVHDEFCCTYTTEFMVRELGYVRIDPNYDYLPKSYRFDLSQKMKLVKKTPEVWRTLYFQSKHIIGLPITPGGSEHDCIPYKCLEEVLQDIYYYCKRPGANIVAYKGGDKEKNLLERLEIPSVDLQCFGCPSFKDLIKFGRVFSTLRDCGHHTELKKGKLMHCPKAEVIAYRDWYKMNYERYSSSALSEACQSTASSSHASSSALSYSGHCTSSDSD